MKALAKILILKPLYNLLIFFAAIVPGHSIGWAIILLTLVVRLLLYLPTRRSIHAQRKLQDLQPQLAALKDQHKDDQQAQAKAMMELYKQHGVSPFGACLPMLVQLPILFILYYVFTISLNSERFDLLYSFTPRPEILNTHFAGIDLAKIDPFVLPLIAGVSQFIASWQLMPKIKSTNKQIDVMGSFSKQMMYIFPVMTFLIARTLPAALSLYWITTTIFSIAQQYLVFRHVKTVDVPALQKSGVEVVVKKKKT